MTLNDFDQSHLFAATAAVGFVAKEAAAIMTLFPNTSDSNIRNKPLKVFVISFNQHTEKIQGIYSQV